MNNSSLSRRAFLAAAGAAPFAASVAFAQSKKIPLGIELYSVRGELGKDMPGTVRAISATAFDCSRRAFRSSPRTSTTSGAM